MTLPGFLLTMGNMLILFVILKSIVIHGTRISITGRGRLLLLIIGVICIISSTSIYIAYETTRTPEPPLVGDFGATLPGFLLIMAFIAFILAFFGGLEFNFITIDKVTGTARIRLSILVIVYLVISIWLYIAYETTRT